MSAKIVIIGSGISGIAAATKLYENGFHNLIILESENRIGGRIFTTPFASNVIDLGAQWCHGEKDNVVYELSKELNVLNSDKIKYNKFEYRQSNGNIIDQCLSNKLFQLAESIRDYEKDLNHDKYKSLGKFMNEKLNFIIKNNKQYQDIDDNLAQEFLEFFHKYQKSIEGSDTLFDTSITNYTHYRDCEGDQLINWKDKGYKKFIDILMKKFPDPKDQNPIENKIILNKSVSNIDWNDTCNKFLKISCKDGSIFNGDHVISTISLGVLKERHLEMFNPPLPNEKKNAIEGLGFGTVNKIFIEFQEPFWSKDWLGCNLLWTKNDLELLCSPKNEWLSDIFGFYTIDYQPNILVAWISGANSRRMEILSNEEITKGIMFLLRKFIADKNIEEPLCVKNSKWYSNENFRGSYSFRNLKSDDLKVSASDLALPLKNSLDIPVLLFAGEATHEHYYSTVHGAVETGWREAQRLIDFYKNKNQKSIEKKEIEKYDVIILGAGCAGLGAGLHLKTKSTKKFCILEGQTKAGGRVETVELKSYPNDQKCDSKNIELVEAGAQWLHGKNNKLFEIIKKHNLISEIQSEEGNGLFIREDGFVFDEFIVKKIDFIVGEILEECNKFSFDESSSYPDSVEKFLNDKFQQYIKSIDSDYDKIIAKQLYDWHVRFQIIDNSCISLKTLSSKSWGDYCFNGEDCQAHFNIKENGFQYAIKKIIEDIGENNIKLNKEVLKIDWKDENCIVECKDGTIFCTEHLIITFSLGVLKSSNLFSKNLNIPKRILKSIEDFGFDAIEKIYLKFEYPWWGDTQGIQLIWNDTCSYNTAGWVRHLTGFDVLFPGPPNTLLGWIGGHGAIEMSKLTDCQIVNDCIKVLSDFTKINVPQPIKYYCSRWYSNRFIRGAYSYSSTNCDRNKTEKSAFSEPVTLREIQSSKLNGNRPVILFSGEACHVEYFSTVHGAFLHGIQQANKILEYYENK